MFFKRVRFADDPSDLRDVIIVMSGKHTYSLISAGNDKRNIENIIKNSAFVVIVKC